jgi:predicted ATPase
MAGSITMNQYIKRLKVVGLHRRVDLAMEFSEGVNIVHGVNGAGKTTMLHILANAANLDLERFTALAFRSIYMEVADGPPITIFAEPGQNGSHSSQVALHIDGDHVATSPPRENQTERDEHPRHRGRRQIRQIRAWMRNRGISLEATYFPAFRTMSEAWSSLDLSELFQNGMLRRRSPTLFPGRSVPHSMEPDAYRGSPEYEAQTALARELFGQFVPQIAYPSPREIQRELDAEIQRAVNRLAGGDRSLLSDTFHRVFAAISQEASEDGEDPRTPDAIRTRIGDQLQKLQNLQSEYGLPDINSDFDALQSQIDSSGSLAQDQDVTTTRVLRVYEHALEERENNLRDAFETVRAYINAVNRFFNDKQLVTASTHEIDATPRLQIRYGDGNLSELDTLSSGERQIAGLIYSASRMARGSVILVDEPELSLHIDWQRTIIKAMVQQLPLKQLIVCTHSPVVGAEYGDQMKELVPQATEFSFSQTMKGDCGSEEWAELDDSEEID